MNNIKKLFFFVYFFTLISCSDSLDFNQLDDYINKPIITSSLTYFTVLPIQFVDSNGGVSQNTITDIFDFEVFQNQYVRDNVVKIDFNAEIKNEFDKKVTILVDFLDDNESKVYELTPLEIDSNKLNFSYIEEVDIVANPNILSTTKFKVTLELEDTGTPLNPNSTEVFEFKSSAVFYLESSL